MRELRETWDRETVPNRPMAAENPEIAREAVSKSVSRCAIAVLILAAMIACAAPVRAQDSGDWRATSSNALAITGDLRIAGTKLFINLNGFTIAPIRALRPAEASALFDLDPNPAGGGNLYRLNVPAAQRFLHRNTLCGTDDTQWMATFSSGKTLEVAFFSGDATPVITFDALSHSSNLCGTFSYSR